MLGLSAHEFDDFLSRLTDSIVSKKERQEVRDEVYDHLMCRYETNIAVGKNYSLGTEAFAFNYRTDIVSFKYPFAFAERSLKTVADSGNECLSLFDVYSAEMLVEPPYIEKSE